MAKLIIAGSINMDVVATVDRHPAVGETVAGKELHFFPGGKGANQAVAASKLGANTIMVGKLGKDGFADDLATFLRDQGVDLTHVSRTDNASTGTALIALAAATGQNSIVVVPGANGLLEPSDLEAVKIERGDVLVSQFEIPTSTIKAFFQRGRDMGAINILNPAPARSLDKSLLELVEVLVLNETELAFFIENKAIPQTVEDVATAARRLRLHPDQIIVVTLGAEGAVAVYGERVVPIQGHKVQAVDTTGAGDCFVGALAARLAEADHLDRALQYANAAASICVQRMGAGTSMPTKEDVKLVIRNETK